MPIRMPKHNEPDARRRTLYSPSFDSGMDDTTPPYLLDYTAAQELRNVMVDEHGIAMKRLGTVRFKSISDTYTATEKHVRGMGILSDEASYYYLVWAYGEKLAVANLEAPYGADYVTETLATGQTFVEFAKWGQKLYYSDGTNGIKYLTYSAGVISTTSSTATISARVMAVRRSSERLFAVKTADTRYLYWTSQFTQDDVEPTWDFDNNVWFADANITGLAEMGDVFVIFTADGLFRIDGTDPTTWDITRVPSDGLGCVAHHTIQVINGVLVYLSPKGVAYYDGSRPRIISQPVRDLLPTRPDYWMEAFAVHDGERYVLYLSSTGGMAQNDPVGCDIAYAWNYRNNTWEGPWTYSPRVSAGVTNWQAQPANIPLTGNTLPMVYLGSKGDNYDNGVGNREGWTYRLAYDTNGDWTWQNPGGATYAMTVKTRAFSTSAQSLDVDRDKEAREVRVLVYSGGTQDVTVNVYAEDSVTPVATKTETITSGEHVIRKAVRIPRRRYFYIEITNSSNSDLHIKECSVDFYDIDHG